MGMWPRWRIDDYIERHATIDETGDLVEPPDTPVDPRFPAVAAPFWPMGDWMEWLDQTLDDRAFRLLVHRYRRDAADFRSRLARQFEPLPRAAAGRAVLAEIGRSRHVARFVPNWNIDDPLNADAIPRASVRSGVDDTVNAAARGVRFRSGGRRRVGTGRGTNSLIRYTPQLWGPGRAANSKADADQPDVVIFHELVHAARQARGLQEPNAPGDDYRDYDNFEEYVAIVVTNIYMSERNLAGLLGGHDDEPLRRPEKFLDNDQRLTPSPRELMRRLKTTQREFYDDLAAVPARFNPVREHEAELRAGRALAGAMLGG
ncbi:M91 family zinc metallopeptidase [Methylocella sp.]|uniref:M91 family zinc metallopeptidase n=1 Tax=Methylocella sp. TaxID=1978226 RepID=UPI0037847ADE